MLNIGVIGYGYWGPNLVRNFMTSGETRVTMVCDMSQPRLDKVATLYPGVGVTRQPDELINDRDVDAVHGVALRPDDQNVPHQEVVGNAPAVRTTG